jgi:hypothetical protein
MSMAPDSAKKLPPGGVSQLETRVQRLPSDVYNIEINTDRRKCSYILYIQFNSIYSV